MIKILSIITSIIITIITISLAVSFFIRIRLPYNSEGVFFDQSTQVVYYQQSAEILGHLMFLTLLINLVFVYFTKKQCNLKTN